MAPKSNTSKSAHLPLHILLADDDRDDRFLFDKALKTLTYNAKLTAVEDGEKLIAYLLKNSTKLPDVLFLDLNMPLKNGSECLTEIKLHPKLNKLPVIIYSTSLHEDIADLLYDNGADYYVRKTEVSELEKILQVVVVMIAEKKFVRPPRNKFVLNMVDA